MNIIIIDCNQFHLSQINTNKDQAGATDKLTMWRGIIGEKFDYEDDKSYSETIKTYLASYFNKNRYQTLSRNQKNLVHRSYYIINANEIGKKKSPPYMRLHGFTKYFTFVVLERNRVKYREHGYGNCLFKSVDGKWGNSLYCKWMRQWIRMRMKQLK